MSKTGHNVSYEAVCKAFDDMKVSDFKDDELSDFTDALCDDGLKNVEHQTRAILRILAINHVQMARHITNLDAANGRTQRWVIRLSIAALIAGGLQAAVALAFYFGHPSVSKSYDEHAPSNALQGDGGHTDPSPSVSPSPTSKSAPNE